MPKLKLEPKRKKTRETRAIEKALTCAFAGIEAYRANSASLRIRIIDEKFRGLSRIDREEMVLPLIRKLPEETQRDITMLLLLAPGEEPASLLNLEFEDPRRSSIL